jgi:hypothetical protein
MGLRNKEDEAGGLWDRKTGEREVGQSCRLSRWRLFRIETDWSLFGPDDKSRTFGLTRAHAESRHPSMRHAWLLPATVQQRSVDWKLKSIHPTDRRDCSKRGVGKCLAFHARPGQSHARILPCRRLRKRSMHHTIFALRLRTLCLSPVRSPR